MRAAGLGRPRLRVVVPPQLPDALATEAASARPLQQVLFDAADGIASPDPARASRTDAKVK